MFEGLDLEKATTPRTDHPLSNRSWKPLYHAINRMLTKLGAEGSISPRDSEVTAVMDALHVIDDGVYEEDF